MIYINGGEYLIGTNANVGLSSDKEGPKIKIYVDSYLIDATAVTNEDFEKFVVDTGYITDAEKFGWSFVFYPMLTELGDIKYLRVNDIPWWVAAEEANWRHPIGPKSNISQIMDHPVVHVSRNDALAYCNWSGKRLPSEAEWEIAAKGGTENEKFPWGDDNEKINGKYNLNIWQGDFPFHNSLEDGYFGTAPAKSFIPNQYGCYNMIGNVWEWCSNPAQISLTEFKVKSGKAFCDEYSVMDDNVYAIRGGSFLCHESYCNRYRICSRYGNTGMTSAINLGFRCVQDV